MFDVNQPQTMEGLTKWWQEFRDRAPLADEDVHDYCCVVVGNKMDLVDSGSRIGKGRVTEEEATQFLEQLIPPLSRPPSPIYPLPAEALPEDADESDDDDPLASSQLTVRPPIVEPPTDDDSPSHSPSSSQMRSDSIAIVKAPDHSLRTSSYSPKHRLSKSRSRSSSRYYSGTMTTTHTTLTIYHTPSSSFFDSYLSARSSPEPFSSSSVSSASDSPLAASARPRRLTTVSNGSASSGSGATITPSIFARDQDAHSTAGTTPETNASPQPNGAPALPPPPDHGAKLFFTSAMTGEGVSDVFEYIARRVITRWEYQERVEARKMHIREASAADTIRLGLGARYKDSGGGGWHNKCC